MRLVLRLKVNYHPNLKGMLLAAAHDILVEDCSSRTPSPWGCQRCSGERVGDNLLGTLWMKLREEVRALP